MIVMDFRTLFRRGDPDTSREAAAAQTPEKHETLRAKIRAWAVDFGPFTDRDLEAAFPGVPGSSLRTRRSELVREGRIVDTGARHRPKGRRTMIVWGAAP